MSLEAVSLAECVARLLALDAAELPEEDLRTWLAARNLGLVPVAEPAAFGWAGPWIARIVTRDGARACALAFGAPDSAVVEDPLGALDPGAWPPEAGWVLAPLEPGRPTGALPGVRAATGIVEAVMLGPAAEAPMRNVSRAEAVPGRGLRGDRYFEAAGTFSRPGALGLELTLVEAEVLDELQIAPEATRRNVVTRGIALDDLIGRAFTVGAVECVGRRRCEPCAHLQRVSGPGILRALVHRGGLRADVVSGGEIAVGAAVTAG